MRGDASIHPSGSLPFAPLYTRPRAPRPTLPQRRGFDTEGVIAAFVATLFVVLVMKELL